MNENTSPKVREWRSEVTLQVKENHTWFLLLGILLTALGAAVVAFPFVATLAVQVLIGWILLISGAAAMVHAYRVANWKGFMLSLLGALVSVGMGVVLLLYPLTGLLSLVLLIAVFFLATGLFRILLAFRVRPFDHWGWLLGSGLLAVAFAALIVIQRPTATPWVINLLLGIDLIFAGGTSIKLALAARRST